MRKSDQRFRAACEIAKRRAFRNVTCHVCRGKGIGRHPAPEEETGYAVLDPCPGCDGYGFAFRVAASLELSVGELLDRYREAP